MLNASEALIDCVGWALLHFLWQGLLGGVLAAVALVAMRRCSASARYVAAVPALFALAALPVATVIWLANGTQAEAPLPVAPQVTQATPEARVAPVIAEQPEAAPAVARDTEAMAMNDVPPLPMEGGIATYVRGEVAVSERRVEVSQLESAKAFCAARLNWIVNGWLVGVALLSLRMLVGWGRVQRLKRLAQQPASEALQGLLARLIERLKVSRPVRLVESALVEVPTVIGWLKPVILLPATALSGLSTSQLEALLAHELAHVRRNDYLINLMQSVIETLLFYHPAVWWLSRRIRIEREHCCDDLAVQVCGDELSYAKALVALEELRGPQLKLAMSADGGSLLGRVARLLGAKERTTAPPSVGSVALSLVVIAMLALATADGGWAILPVRSESDATPNQSEEKQDIEAEKEVSNEVTADAADNAPEGRAGVPDLRSLVDAIAESSKKLATGRMRVEWEKVTDQSWISGKKDQAPVKTVGKMTWRDDGKQWRVDFDGELPNSGAGGKVTNSLDLWSTGFDGERFYNFDRDAKSLVIGELHQSARVYEPVNLFWNPTSGGVESVLDVLRKPEVTVSKAMLDGLEGYRVERILEREDKWRWSAFVCPRRSYLSLEIQQFFKDQLSWECKLSDLAEVQPGVWYPQKIRRTSFNVGTNGQSSVAWQNDYSVKEFKLGVEEAQSWPTFAERSTGFAHPTSKAHYGIHINDLTRGSAYFNDPWWPELEPILKQKHAWPKTSLLPLENVKSQFEKAPTTTFRFLNGAALPKFETKDGNSLVWTAGPDEKKPQPKVTFVLFWAPWEERSVKALVAAKRLHEELSKHGLQVVAVQDSHQAAKTPAAFLKSLALPFPTILDEFPEVEGDLGKDTIRKTLGVRGMPTGCLLDHEHRVMAITDQKKLTVQIAELLKAARQSLDPSRSQAEPGNELPILKMDEPLSDEIGRAAEAEWKELVAKAEPRTHIKGRVVTEKNVPMAAVVVEIQPRLKLARGGNGGLTVYPDYKATKTFRTNAGGVFDAQSLPKGAYEVRVKAGGYARRTFDVAVGPGQLGELGDIVLDQRDAISGLVVDDNGRVLVGAKVEALWRHTDPKNVAIKTRSPGAMPKTLVRGDGSFFLNELEAGRYTLEFDAAGHEREVREAVPLGWLSGKVWLDAYPEPLLRKVSLKVQDATLFDALRKLSEQAKVELEVDPKIEIEGLTRNSLEPFRVQSFEVQDKPLGDALEVLLAPFDESVRLGFAWDGKKVFVSTHEAAKKHRLPPLETVKGAARERYAQLARERAMQELQAVRPHEWGHYEQTAEEAVAKTPSSVAPLALKKLKQMVEVARIEHEIAVHDNLQLPGQPNVLEFKKTPNELLIARVEAAIALNKLELEIADEANKQKSGSVKEEELQRLQMQVESLEKDLKRLSGKPMAAVEKEGDKNVIVGRSPSTVGTQQRLTAEGGHPTSARERSVRAGIERAAKELDDAQRANAQTPGTVASLAMQQLEHNLDALRADLELTRFDDAHSDMKLLSSELKKQRNELSRKALQAVLTWHETKLEMATEANRKQADSVPRAELKALEQDIATFKENIALIKNEQAAAPFNRDPLGSALAGVDPATDGVLKRAPQRVAVKRPDADQTRVVRGQVTLTGKIPKLPPIPIYDRNLNYPWRRKDPSREEIDRYNAELAKDPAKFDPRKLRDEALVVSEGGGLENVFIYLKKAPVGWKPTPVPNSAVILWTDKDRFRPRGLIARVGQQVILSAVDFAEAENFHWFSLRNNAFNIMAPLGKAIDVPASSLQFPETLPREIRSDIHPWKRAQLLVLDHPFAAVTVEGGHFSIEGLPPGTHEFVVWHERHGYLDKKLSVTVKADEPTPELKLSYPAESLRLHERSLETWSFDSAKSEPKLFEGADWADINNEFIVKPGEPAFAKFEVRLRNPSKVPLTVQLPEGKWTQRREIKVRTLHVTLEPAADAKRVPLVVPESNIVKVPLADDMLDLSGLEPGYWSVILKTPILEQPSYLHMWIEAPAESAKDAK